MRILITGSRDWADYDMLTTTMVEAVRSHIEQRPELGTGATDWVTVVHGDCPTGADRMAQSFCEQVTFWETERHPADWARYGKRAGFVRNAEMVALGADVCLAFIKNESRGASMTASFAEQAGIETRRFTA